jgi:hypothetical protein
MSNFHRALLVSAMLAALSACESRSISNSGYQPEPAYGYNANPQSAFYYQGELSAYDVLGGDVRSGVSDAEIAKTLDTKHAIALKSGADVMLVQSGAPFADPEMMAAVQKHYRVSSFTGVPWQDPAAAKDTTETHVPYSQRFRLVAARGGFETVIVYWGVLESGREDIATKAVSWVPFIGGNVPDEVQRMRIRLVAAVIDVRTGQWETYVPEPFEDTSWSNRYNREASDQEQVLLLKAKGYQALADGLAAKYGG